MIGPYPLSIATFKVPLFKIQNIINFTVVISIEDINFQINFGVINFFIRQTSHTLSEQTLTITSPYGRDILNVKIRQMIISPYFVGVYISSFSKYINLKINITSPVSQSFTFATTVDTSSGGIFKTFLIGYHLTFNSTYGLAIKDDSMSPTSFNIIIYNNVAINLTISDVQFFVVAFTSSAIVYDGLKITVFSSPDKILNNSATSYNYSNINIQTDFVFYGFSVASSSYPRYLGSLSCSVGYINYSSTMIGSDINIKYIVLGVDNVFVSVVVPLNCPRQYSYLDIKNQLCYDSCPVQTIQIPPSCNDCWANCSMCFPVTFCSTCDQSVYPLSYPCTILKACSVIQSNLTDYVCHSCAVKFYAVYNSLNVIQACLPCLFGCNYCTSNLTCKTCSPGYSQASIKDNCSPIRNCQLAQNTITYSYCIKCKPFYYQIYNSVNNTIVDRCIKCQRNCITCINKTICTLCAKGFRAEGGCSGIDGCLAFYYQGTTQICYKCDPTQNMMLYNNACICLPDFWILNNLCINITGCLAARRVNSQNICLGCDLVKKFLYNATSHGCYCLAGTVLISSQSRCQDVCGDGQSIFLQCDDGNKLNQDGCSSKCQIQSGWTCNNDNPLAASKCVKNRLYINFTLKQAWKIQGQNRGLFVFQAISDFRIPSQLFTDLLLTSNKSAKLLSWFFKDGYLQMAVDYNETIQGFPASIKLMLNSSFTNFTSIDSNFEMISNQANLIVYNDQEQIIKIKKILQIFSLSILGLFVLANFLHKMIGVESLNVFQMISILTYFSHIESPTIMAIRRLQITNFNYYLMFNGQSCFYLQKNADQYDFNNIQYSVMAILCVLLVSLLIYFVKQYFKSDKTKKKQNEAKINSFYRYYNIVVYPWLVGFLYVNCFAILGQAQIQHKLMRLKTLFIFMTAKGLYLFVTLKQIWRWRCDTQKPFGLKQANDDYLPVYLIFTFAQMSLLLLNSYQLITFLTEGFTVVNCVFSIWFFYRMPYKKMIHNIGQGFNLLALSIFSIWIVVRNYLNILAKQEYQLISLYLNCAIYVLVCVMLLVRLLAQLYNDDEQQKMIVKKRVKRHKYKFQQQQHISVQCDKQDKQMQSDRQDKQRTQQKNKVIEEISNIKQNQEVFMQGIMNFKQNQDYHHYSQHKKKAIEKRNLAKHDFFKRKQIIQQRSGKQ